MTEQNARERVLRPYALQPAARERTVAYVGPCGKTLAVLAALGHARENPQQCRPIEDVLAELGTHDEGEK